jgi:hypothetical protein
LRFCRKQKVCKKKGAAVTDEEKSYESVTEEDLANRKNGIYTESGRAGMLWKKCLQVNGLPLLIRIIYFNFAGITIKSKI